MSTELIKVSINEKDFHVPKGSRLIDVCRENSFEMAGLLERVELNLRESHDHRHGTQPEGNKDNENPALHPISLEREVSSKQARAG